MYKDRTVRETRNGRPHGQFVWVKVRRFKLASYCPSGVTLVLLFSDKGIVSLLVVL